MKKIIIVGSGIAGLSAGIYGLLNEYNVEIYGSEFELIDVLTPLTYERYVNAYKGGFMTYLLLPRINQVIRSAKVEGLDNFVLANQWLMLPGGTPVAVVQGKFAIKLILNMDYRDYNID
ncbi:MAG: hypothetical protein IJA65_04515 [Acholeplasmatales bacterium]|nr:hypothetical protein [Acholeplasmatales bacterium]